MRYSSFETALSEDYRECSSDRVFIVDDKHSRSELGIERGPWGRSRIHVSRSMPCAVSPEQVIPSPRSTWLPAIFVPLRLDASRCNIRPIACRRRGRRSVPEAQRRAPAVIPGLFPSSVRMVQPWRLGLAGTQKPQMCLDSMRQVSEDRRVLRREIQRRTALIQLHHVSHHLFDDFTDQGRPKTTSSGVKPDRQPQSIRQQSIYFVSTFFSRHPAPSQRTGQDTTAA